jgi:hypothetical protein
MNVRWLRKLLHRLPGDMEVYIMVDGKMIPLCGKTDLTLLVYNTQDEPDVDKGEQALTLSPCHCHDDDLEEPDERTVLN